MPESVEGLTADLIGKYKLWLGRLASFCEGLSVFTVRGITGEVVIGFCKDWERAYPSTLTRSKLRERYKSFMRFCLSHGWLTRLPEWPKIQSGGKAPTIPLTAGEYIRLLDAVYVAVKAPQKALVPNQTYEYWTARVHGLFQLMRWSGLSIMDALTLRRDELLNVNGAYRVVTQRTKTGTDVSVPLPPDVAVELLAVPNENARYFFWSWQGSKKSICGNGGKRFIIPAFREAKIDRRGRMLAHRLRDTFAVDLLQRGVPLEDVSKLLEQKQGQCDVSSVSEVGIFLMKMPAEICGSPYSNPASALGHTSIKTTERSYAAWVQGRQDRLDALVTGTWAVVSKPKRRTLNVRR